MSVPFPEPTEPAGSRAEVLLRYLDHFRADVLDAAAGLTEQQLRGSVLPSGWSPLELLTHLTFVEMRWLEWGFEGRPVADPWGDHVGDRWRVPPGSASRDVVEALRRRGTITTAIVNRHDLDEMGAPGERWEGTDPATLERCLLHLLQEYARHAGHLDVVAELIAGRAVGAALRFEVFPADLDATVGFYRDVLGFALVRDERGRPYPYVSLRRDAVQVGAATRPAAADPERRRPPVGVELVLEVDDIDAERARVAAAGWPVVEDLTERPWGLRDFRLLDPDGYYLRVTGRAQD